MPALELPPALLSPAVVACLALGACAVGLVGLLLAVAASLRLRRLRRRYALLHEQVRGEDFVTVLSRELAEVARLRDELAATSAALEAVRLHVAGSLRHVSVVRYDAFGTGGRLSFSAALLDDAGTGIVLTSLHARAESRTYAKAVTAGGSDAPLSPEEQRAMRDALELRVPVLGTAAPAPA